MSLREEFEVDGNVYNRNPGDMRKHGERGTEWPSKMAPHKDLRVNEIDGSISLW